MPNPPSQLRLFERAEEMSIDTAFRTATRVQLDATSWVEHVSGWLTRHDLLMASLAALPTWTQRERWMYTKLVDEPRLTAVYPEIADVPVAIVQAIGDALSTHYGVRYDSCWMNLYRDQRDSTAWHFDRNCKREMCIVPVLSLGETRRFLMRHRDGGPSVPFQAAGGDLIVMGGRAQRDWVHCVPKEARPAGARISINFGSREQNEGQSIDRDTPARG